MKYANTKYAFGWKKLHTQELIFHLKKKSFRGTSEHLEFFAYENKTGKSIAQVVRL